jgi:hypothetical protein
VILIKIFKKITFGQCVAGAYGKLAAEQFLGFVKPFFACFQHGESAGYIFIEGVSVGGKLHSAGAAGKKPDAQGIFQSLYRLAHGRLAEIQLFGSRRDIALIGNHLKDLIMFYLRLHNTLLDIRNTYDKY